MGACLGPIPKHLRKYRWYAAHQAWLRDNDYHYHWPGKAKARRLHYSSNGLPLVFVACDLTCAILCEAFLQRAIFRNVDLNAADLSWAYMPGVEAFRTEFVDTRFDHVTATGAHITQCRVFPVGAVSGQFDMAAFVQTTLTGFFQGALFTKTCLSQSILEHAEFKGCDFTGAVFERSRLLSCTARDCQLTDITMKLTDCRQSPSFLPPQVAAPGSPCRRVIVPVT